MFSSGYSAEMNVPQNPSVHSCNTLYVACNNTRRRPMQTRSIPCDNKTGWRQPDCLRHIGRRVERRRDGFRHDNQSHPESDQRRICRATSAMMCPQAIQQQRSPIRYNPNAKLVFERTSNLPEKQSLLPHMGMGGSQMVPLLDTIGGIAVG